MNPQRRGFSLVLALAVMGLLVLVVLSLSGLLAVESRVAAAGLAGRQARLNAIAASRLALGQLQLLAGNDQRVTARADIFDKDATGASRNTYYSPINSAGLQVDAERRWWTGVWMTGSGGTVLRSWDPALPDNRIFLGWLVSPEPSGSPVLQLAPSSTLTKADSDTLAARILDDGATQGGARLLGPNDLGSSAPASEQVRRPGFPLPEGGGSIAWWTSDEGLKARINLVDPLLEPAEGSPINFPAVNVWWKGFRLAAFGQSGAEPASSGTARVPGLREARDADLRAAAARTPAQGAEGTDLVRLRTRPDLQVWLNNRGASAAAENGIASGWHHLTGVSRGVMSNTLDGGLKIDLSVAFELPYETVTNASGTTRGWKDLTCFAPSPDRNNLFPNLATGVSESTEGAPSIEWNNAELLRYVFEVPIPELESRGRARAPFTVAGPTWDLLRSHYRLYKREIEPLIIPGVPWTVSANTWLARGSAPYTFQAGSPTQATTRPSPNHTFFTLPKTPPALFGPKANLAALQPLAASGIAQPRHLRTLTLEDGSTATRIRELRARLAPQVTRVGMVHSLIYCQNTLAIGLDGFLALHNPYDVPLEFAGIGVTWAQFNNTRFNIYRADAPTVPIATCTLGDDFNPARNVTVQRSYSFRGFHTYPIGGPPAGRWNYIPTTYLRIEPGETRILTPNLAGNRWQVFRDFAYQHMSMAAFAYDLQSNFRINAHRISNGAQITQNAPLLDSMVMPSSTGSGSEPLIVEMMVGDVSQVNAFDIHLYRANRHATSSGAPGWWAWLGEDLLFGQNPRQIASDHSDEHLLQRVSFRANAAFAPAGSDGAVRGQPFPRSSAVDGTRNLADKRFFAISELRLRSAAETNGFPIPVLAFNPRAQLADPRNWDGQSATSPGWQASIKTLSGDPLTELQFWPGNVPEKNQASWGDSHFPGSGTRTTILFQVPRRPLLSIAQLAHADIGELDLDPTYAIGNSYAHTGLDELDKILYWPPNSSSAKPLERVDLSFAANMGLWDRTFFSGLNAGTSTSEDGTIIQPHATLQIAADRFVAGNIDATANRRLRFWLSRADAPVTDLEATVIAAAAKRRDALLNPATTARQMMQEGTFNVNSTSVDAWKAQLTGGFGTLANGLTKRPEHPFSRFHPPAGESLESGETNRWRTYRSFAEGSPALDLLAQAIVTEVRARGPFMSLADFVNRRLKSDANGLKGSLQAAIDAAGLNPDIVATAIGSSPALTRLPQAAALAPSGVPAEAPVALGRPDMILQSDILTAIGPHLSARSDTFVIRAYGEHKGASAWCEITVQRTPDWIVPQTAEATIPNPDYRTGIKRSKGELAEMSQRNPAIKAVNLALGRRFVITDFRWIPAP